MSVIAAVHPRRATLIVILAAGAVVLASVVTMGSGIANRSNQFWGDLLFTGASSPHYDSLAQLESASDVVILGRILRVDEGRVFGDPHPDNPNPEEELVAYVTARIQVDQILRGALEDPSEGIVQLEIPMPRKDALAQLVGEGPAEQAVFFLFNSGRLAAEQGRSAEVQEVELQYYALVAFGAVVRNLGEKASPVHAAELEFLAAYESEPFDDFIERIVSGP